MTNLVNNNTMEPTKASNWNSLLPIVKVAYVRPATAKIQGI